VYTFKLVTHALISLRYRFFTTTFVINFRYLKTSSSDKNSVPGVVIAVQTFGDFLNFNPHLHYDKLVIMKSEDKLPA
jgi:hypothetical protein